eukprot:494160-Amphidinium_carterae.1
MTQNGSDVPVSEDFIAVSPAKPAQKRRKGNVRSGTVTKDDMKRYMDQLSESLQGGFDRNFASLANDVRGVHTLAEDAFVINGWSTPQHRSTLIVEVNTILSRALEEEDTKLILQRVTISAPKVRGKIALVDLLPPHRAFEVKSVLQDAFLANDLKARIDRTMEERLRSSTLVAAARAMDVYLTEKGRERSEICWSDGIVWADDIKAGQYIRAGAIWTWNIKDSAAILT